MVSTPRLLLAALALAPAALAAPTPAASAEPNRLCGAELPLEALEGSYTLTIGGGVLPGEGWIVPVGVVETYGVAIVADDDRFVMQFGPSEVAFRPVPEDAPVAGFAAGIATADMSRPAFERIVGCEIADLPRLIARQETTDAASAPVELVYELIVYQYSPGRGGRMVGTLSRAGDMPERPRVIHLRPQRPD